MVKETKIILRTRHINCFYCIAVSFFILAIVLFALSSEQTKVFGNRTPVIVSASIILLLSIVILVWITYYTIGYCRLKKHEQLNRCNKQENQISSKKTSDVIFDNAAFTMDDPIAGDSSTNIQTSA
jgi:hypothetical protein